MTARSDLVVVDGDGHLLEDLAQIATRMPTGYISAARRSGLADVFPPKDHLHSSQPVHMLEKSFAQVGPDGWLEFLDKVGIVKAALYPTFALQYGFIVNPDWAIGACRAYNDWLYETYLQLDDRFIGMGLLPMQEPAAAAEELHRIVTELGMRGAMLPATGLASPLGSAPYWPVYEEANRLGCAISVHGGAHVRMGLDLLEVYTAVNALGHPFGQLIAFSSMLVNGVFDRYPRARFAFLEAGVTWLLLALERFARAWETHVPLDPRHLSAQLRDDESITDHIGHLVAGGRIFTGCEGEEPYLPVVVRALGANPAFFSSDFPHETTEDRCRAEIDEVAENEDLSEDDRRKVLAGNALTFYGFA
jgi:predicted TIM-barrel fold metal-dependent hydrolase